MIWGVSEKMDTFREFKVVRKIVENEVITSFYLKPCDGMPLSRFKPGQFLTLRIEDEATGSPITRTYSVSSSPLELDYFRISVKRELAPAGQPELAPGMFSNYLHDRVEEGASIMLREPAGHFYLNEDSERPVVLLSGGVGLTPMVSMAHTLVRESTRKVWFVHACENGSTHAFGNEIKALAEHTPQLKHHVCYRMPTEADVKGQDYDDAGYVTSSLLQSLLPLDDYEFYLCGPPPFMEAEFKNLINLGVREDRISYEFFGPATVLRRAEEVADESSQTVQPVVKPTAPPADSPQVTFAASDITATWNPEFESILEFAESLGLSPEFSCRAGICNTCSCKLSSGEVSYSEEPLDEPEQGNALICCSVPESDVVLDI